MRTAALREKKNASSLQPAGSSWFSDRLSPQSDPSLYGTEFGHSYAELAIFPPDTTQHDLELDQADTDREEHETADAATLPEGVESVLNTPGRPLLADARTRMEARFETSFADVRLHSDGAAMQSAAEVGATAYTVGPHIVLSGEPSSLESSALLAHELTHVVQQRGGGMIPELSRDAAHEREADRVANAVVVGPTKVAVQHQTGVGLARQPTPDEQQIVEDHVRLENQKLDTQKERAAEILAEEGIDHQPHPNKAHRTKTARVGIIKQGLERVAGDPGSPRQKAAQALLGEINETQKKISDLEKQRSNRNQTYSRQGSKDQPSPQSSKSTDAKQISNTPNKQVQTKNAPVIQSPSTTNKPKPVSSQSKPSGNVTSTPLAKGSTSPVDAAKKQAFSSALAGHLATSSKSLARLDRFLKGLSAFLTAKGALDHALGVLEAIKDMTSLLAHGTALPAEQRQADQVLQQSTEASDWAGSVMDDVPVLSWIPLIDGAARLEDAQSLFAIDEHLTQLGSSLEKSQLTFQDLAQELAQNAADLKGAQFKQLVEIVMPHMDGTASNATAFALYQSLEKLHGAILAASKNYAAAANTLSGYVAALKGLSDSANSAGWDAAQLQARRRYEREHGKH